MLDAVIEAGIKGWLNVVIAKWPSYTGTMRATLKPVGRLVNMTIPKLATPGEGKKKYFTYGGTKYPLGWNIGERYGKAKLESEASKAAWYAFWKKKEVAITFTFDSDLLYAIWNEIQAAPFPLKTATPYKVMPEAMGAMRRIIMQTLPKVMRTNVTFTRTGLNS